MSDIQKHSNNRVQVFNKRLYLLRLRKAWLLKYRQSEVSFYFSVILLNFFYFGLGLLFIVLINIRNYDRRNAKTSPSLVGFSK